MSVVSSGQALDQKRSESNTSGTHEKDNPLWPPSLVKVIFKQNGLALSPVGTYHFASKLMLGRFCVATILRFKKEPKTRESLPLLIPWTINSSLNEFMAFPKFFLFCFALQKLEKSFINNLK